MSGQSMTLNWSLALCMGLVGSSVPGAPGSVPVLARDSMSAALVTVQAQPASQPAADKNTVARGEIWFYQRCSLCHLERIVKDETFPPLGPSLKGLLKGATANKEAAVRSIITTGTLRMPGFQYGLEARELDELMAFLRTH